MWHWTGVPVHDFRVGSFVERACLPTRAGDDCTDTDREQRESVNAPGWKWIREQSAPEATPGAYTYR
jgi:hypothetical protein